MVQATETDNVMEVMVEVLVYVYVEVDVVQIVRASRALGSLISSSAFTGTSIAESRDVTSPKLLEIMLRITSLYGSIVTS